MISENGNRCEEEEGWGASRTDYCSVHVDGQQISCGLNVVTMNCCYVQYMLRECGGFMYSASGHVTVIAALCCLYNSVQRSLIVSAMTQPYGEHQLPLPNVINFLPEIHSRTVMLQ